MCYVMKFCKIFCSVLLFSLFLAPFCYGANILVYMATPVFSHHLPFKVLIRELVNEGHHTVTSVTASPMRDPTLKTLREVDASVVFDIAEKYKIVEVMANDTMSLGEKAGVLGQTMREGNEAHFQLPEMQNLIEGKNYQFDLVIMEAQYPTGLALGWKYNCPVIAMSSLDAGMSFHVAMGNPAHPIVNSDYNLEVEDPQDLTFVERIQSVLYRVVYIFVFDKFLDTETENLRRYFGEDMPNLKELAKNISMLFVSTNPFFQNPRPVYPHTITIGNGMHLLPEKPLPQKLKKFLDGSKDGAVYFSLGSSIKNNMLNDSVKMEIIKAFGELPYKVLMKLDNKFENLPKNILVEKWIPQQDVLRHPNVKLFVTQGGMQSLQEAIYNDIPLVGIPFFGDQLTNVRNIVKKQIGVRLDKQNITKDSVKESVMEVLNNPVYRENARKYGSIFRDVPVSDLKKAAWWCDYVIRQKGASHFRSISVDMPLWKYHMCDVVAFFAAVVLLVACLVYAGVKIIYRFLKSVLARRVHEHKD